jgi:hypothetical protein
MELRKPVLVSLFMEEGRRKIEQPIKIGREKRRAAWCDEFITSHWRDVADTPQLNSR